MAALRAPVATKAVHELAGTCCIFWCKVPDVWPCVQPAEQQKAADTSSDEEMGLGMLEEDAEPAATSAAPKPASKPQPLSPWGQAGASKKRWLKGASSLVVLWHHLTAAIPISSLRRALLAPTAQRQVRS